MISTDCSVSGAGNKRPMPGTPEIVRAVLLLPTRALLSRLMAFDVSVVGDASETGMVSLSVGVVCVVAHVSATALLSVVKTSVCVVVCRVSVVMGAVVVSGSGCV